MVRPKRLNDPLTVMFNDSSCPFLMTKPSLLKVALTLLKTC